MSEPHHGALLDHARALIAGGATRPGIWTRAAALLTRQTLEGVLDALWQRRAPGTEAASMRAQLLCLPQYLADDGLAGRVVGTYAALSDACHLRAYDLAPTASEVRGWIDAVQDLCTHLHPADRADG